MLINRILNNIVVEISLALCCGSRMFARMDV